MQSSREGTVAAGTCFPGHVPSFVNSQGRRHMACQASSPISDRAACESSHCNCTVLSNVSQQRRSVMTNVRIVSIRTKYSVNVMPSVKVQREKANNYANPPVKLVRLQRPSESSLTV